MLVVALLSGGKDSCFNMLNCVANGHTIVALANLRPPIAEGKDELDSYMYQTVGHDAIDMYADCMGVPLFRREITGRSLARDADYKVTQHDEVEDLLELLKDVQKAFPDVQGVSSGAILSSYQRVRVENVCARLGLTSLAYMWRREQDELMQEIVSVGLDAVLIKVASLGLTERHLGKSLKEMYPHLLTIHDRFGAHICGEGGEFETLTLDCPIFKKRIVLDEVKIVTHSDDAIAVVAYLQISRAHTEPKDPADIGLSDEVRGVLLRNPMAAEPTIPTAWAAESPAEDVTRKCLPPIVISPEPPSPSDCRPRTRSSGSYLTISGVAAYGLPNPFATESIEAETAEIMTFIQAQLAAHELDWDGVIMIHVYIRDMALFGRFNAVYAKYLGLNPPPRVTVQASVPAPDSAVQIDVVASRTRKETLHVQSVSYWAPANIGPYSQAATVGEQVYTAGQIGLIPATMQLPESGEPSFASETFLSLCSLARVADAVGCSLDADAAICVAYITDASRADEARKHTTAGPLLIVTVPGLPRGAQIEWAALFTVPPKPVIIDSSDEEAEDALEVVQVARTTSKSVDIGDTGSCAASAWTRGRVFTFAGTACTPPSSSSPSAPPITLQLITALLHTLATTALDAAARILPATRRKQPALHRAVITVRLFCSDEVPHAWVRRAIADLAAAESGGGGNGGGGVFSDVPVSVVMVPYVEGGALMGLVGHGER
ncbi:ATP binding domain 4 [Geranomyces variabilis]|uniref:Diphthine--ammonia ligase n=1 Tax=Geranomyces variabilis TaxID=109894 RepID=A0AAD5TTX7_9FUNG|nr:ATP binding domain 4 [Geranomyces variabilis]